MKQKNVFVLEKGKVVTPFQVFEKGTIVVEGERIAAVGAAGAVDIPRGAEKADIPGMVATPGFFDLHCHGGGGRDIMNGTYEAMNEVSKFCAKNGVTSFLPTTGLGEKCPHEKILATAIAAGKAIKKGTDGSEVLGVFMEGPYMNPKKTGGDERPPSVSEFDEIMDKSDKAVRVIALAPEVPGAIEFIKHVTDLGVVASIGHSDATYDDLLKAIDGGLSYTCHTFNEMLPIHHRFPGAITGILTRDEITAEIIADGVHVHPAVIRLMLCCKGTDKVVMCTDNSEFTGMPDGTYDKYGYKIVVKEGMVKMTEERVIGGIKEDATIAGSGMTSNQHVKYMVQKVGVPLREVVKMASTNASRLLRVGNLKGSLEAGKLADITIMDRDFNVVMTLVRGKVVHNSMQQLS